MSRVIDAAEIGYKHENLVRVILIAGKSHKVIIDDVMSGHCFEFYCSRDFKLVQQYYNYAIHALSCSI